MSRLTNHEKLNLLHRGMINNLDDTALRAICQELGVNYDEMPGRGKQSKTWMLLEQLRGNNEISRLLHVLRQKKPSINWDKILKGQSGNVSKNFGNAQSNHDGSNLLKNPIVIGAIIGLIGTVVLGILTGYFNLLATNRPIEATQTAEAKLTSVAAMSQTLPMPGVTGPDEFARDNPQITTTATTYFAPTPQPTSIISNLIPAVTVIGITDTPAPTQIPAPDSETSTVFEASVGTFFDGELVITVYETSWEDKRTTFGVSAPGITEEIVADQTVGNRYLYIQNGVFEIAVTSFSSFGEGTEFTVTRLQKPSQGMPTRETVNICKDDTGTSFNKSLLITVMKADWNNKLVSFDVFSPGKGTLQVVNQTVGKKFLYEENGKYEIQIKDISSFGECATFYIWRLN